MEDTGSPITRTSGLVSIKKGGPGYAEFIGEAVEQLRGKVSLDPQQAARVEKSLAGLASTHPLGDGEVSAVIGRTHFDFREVLFDSLKIAVKAAFAVHMADVAGMVDAAIEAVEMACTRFSRLTREEVVIYWALVKLERAQKDAGRPISGSTIAETIEEIVKTSSISSEENIQEGLRHLTTARVISEVEPGRYLLAEKWVK